MKRYYVAIAAGKEPREALWAMQEERFRSLRKAGAERAETESAVLTLGGFVLISTGR